MMIPIYNYPIEITAEEIKNHTGYDLNTEINATKKNNTTRIAQFLNLVYMQVYDQVIYKATIKSVANKIIENNLNLLEGDIKKALLTQANYLLANEGNIGSWNGATKSGETIDIIDIEKSKNRIISCEVYEILANTHPRLLYKDLYQKDGMNNNVQQ